LRYNATFFNLSREVFMSERSPESVPESKEVLTQPEELMHSLREQLVGLYPAACTDLSRRGQVCSRITGFVDGIIAGVGDGSLTSGEAMDLTAAQVQEDACSGPRQYATSNLKCGVDASNFHEINNYI
jgi:hypothetical protein